MLVGEKFNDICVNFLVCLKSPVIRWVVPGKVMWPSFSDPRSILCGPFLPTQARYKLDRASVLKGYWVNYH